GKGRTATLGKHLRDRRRQRRLAVVNVTNRPDVNVRLRPLELRLRHADPTFLRLSILREPYLLRLCTQPTPWRAGAGDGNRTRTTSLEGWGSTIELHPHADPDPLPGTSIYCCRSAGSGGGGWI